MKRRAGFMLLLLLIASGAVGQDAPSPTSDPGAALAASMAHVRVDREARTVEIDGFVPIDAHIKQAPNVYLEVMVSTAETRAHESLVATRADPSHVHAALLLIGLEHGEPGSWTWDGKVVSTVAPSGAPVEVWFIWKDEEGVRREDRACDWIISAVDGRRLTDAVVGQEPRWVFAGSRMVRRNDREWYAATAEGTIVGLHTFGSETVAWRGVFSPSAEVQDPEWIADPARVPRRDTPVTVVIRAIEAEEGD